MLNLSEANNLNYTFYGITDRDSSGRAHCFFLNHEMINNDVTNPVVLPFYADMEKSHIMAFFLRNLKFRASYLENGLVDFDDTNYIIL